MRKYFISKASNNELQKNSQALEFLIFSFINPSVLGVKNVLHENGNFFGKNKTLFLARIHKIFTNLAEESYSLQINRGISLGVFPGAEVIEIRYSIGSEFQKPEKTKLLGETKSNNEIILRFSATFSDDKIYLLRNPKHFMIVNKEITDQN